MSVFNTIELFRKNTVPGEANYRAKLRAFIHECEEHIAHQRTVATTLDPDSIEADLTHRVLRLLEHTQAMQVAELKRIEKTT